MPSSRRLAVTCLAPLALASLAAAQASFSVGGLAATIPAAGTGGGGTWPTSLPPSPMVSYATASVPADGCRFTSLDVWGLTHTWVGDLQIVLRSPTGRMYNIAHRPGFDGSNSGSSADASNASMRFVASEQAQYPPPPSSGPWTTGTYVQSFGAGGGTWPDGYNGIENVDLDAIGAETGVWALAIYDWSAGDTGQIFAWGLEGVRGIPAQYHGQGSFIPASGTGGGGNWPGTLPPSPSSVFTVYTPESFLKITRVSIEGLQHTWVGDLQITLRPPRGYPAVNLAHRPGFTGSGNGNSGDCTGGGYAFISQTGGAATVPPSSGNWSPGTYWQSYGSGGGTWPSGVNSIHNYSLESLPGSEGAWQLEIYDWAGGDTGTFASWWIDGYFLPTGPTAYCTAGTSTNGCTPVLAASGTASVSMMWPFSVSAIGVEAQKSGMIFYGVTGKNAAPWGSSYLCVLMPVQRTPVQNSGGALGTCQGLLTLDWNAFRVANPAAMGQPFTLGESAFFQGWYRDPGSAAGTNFSNAMVVTHTP
jgi:subtilisin-like proprotein convertase family protein